MEGQLPATNLPFIAGDFNACDWAGNGDESIDVLDKPTLARISAKAGMLVFGWAEDDPGNIMGLVATLEHRPLGALTGWRAKPVRGTFYRGPMPAKLFEGAEDQAFAHDCRRGSCMHESTNVTGQPRTKA